MNGHRLDRAGENRGAMATGRSIAHKRVINLLFDAVLADNMPEIPSAIVSPIRTLADTTVQDTRDPP
jgi:ABC-type arginine transport system ATPase subunit